MKKIIKDIFSILDRREKIVLGKLILSDVIISVLDIAFLVALLYIVHFYTEGRHAAQLSYFPLTLFNKYPILVIGAFFILFSMKNLAGFKVLRMQLRFVYGVASRLSGKNLLNYLEGSYPDYVNINSSVHTRKISQQPIEFGHHVLGGFQQIVSQSLLVLITIIATIIFKPALFFLLFVILTPPIILTGFLIKRRMNTVRKTAKPISEMTLQYLQEALAGFIEENIYDRKEFFTNRYHGYQARFNQFLASQQVIQNMPSKLIEVFAVFGFFMLIFIDSYMGNASTVQMITIGAFLGAAYKIIPGIVKILNSVGQIKTYGFTAADQMRDQAAQRVKRGQMRTGISSVTFENVSFSYTEEPVLKHISLVMTKGDFIGLSGMSGKGKTTMVNLLLGFSDPCSGTISMNGILTKGIDRQQYWGCISYVKQQPFMINDSILRNIVLDEQAGDPRKLDEAIEFSGLEELTGIFPEGLNKQLTENGKNISGGQRQRIVFARALYKDADLIILDEPFNELDEASEEKMLLHCRQLTQSGKTILMITHNKKSLSFCNKIVSLNES